MKSKSTTDRNPREAKPVMPAIERLRAEGDQVLLLSTERNPQMTNKGYDVAQNPKDKLWYVIGHCGSKYWVPVSSGFATKAEAHSRIAHQKQADKAALLELATI